MLDVNKTLHNRIQENLEDLETQAYIAGRNHMYGRMLDAMREFFDPNSRDLEYDVIFSTLRRVMREWKAGKGKWVARDEDGSLREFSEEPEFVNGVFGGGVAHRILDQDDPRYEDIRRADMRFFPNEKVDKS